MKHCLYKIWAGMEHIFPDTDSIPGCLSLSQAQDYMARIMKRFLRSWAAAPVFGTITAISIYGYCAPLAYLERGGKTAYGGECLAALAAGFVVWRLVSDWRGGDER